MSDIEQRKLAARAKAIQNRDAIDPDERQRRGKSACERLFFEISAWKSARDAASAGAKGAGMAAAGASASDEPFRVALYDALGSEVPTERLLELVLDAGWIACFPVLTAAPEGVRASGKDVGSPPARAAASNAPARTMPSEPPTRSMAFIQVNRNNLPAARDLFLGHPLRTANLDQLAQAGIRPIEPLAIDAFAVPLVAFDSENRRLGYGGGYYDRALSQVLAGKTASNQPAAHKPDSRETSTPRNLPTPHEPLVSCESSVPFEPFVSGLAFAEQRTERVPSQPHDIPLLRILVA